MSQRHFDQCTTASSRSSCDRANDRRLFLEFPEVVLVQEEGYPKVLGRYLRELARSQGGPLATLLPSWAAGFEPNSKCQFL